MRAGGVGLGLVPVALPILEAPALCASSRGQNGHPRLSPVLLCFQSVSAFVFFFICS